MKTYKELVKRIAYLQSFHNLENEPLIDDLQQEARIAFLSEYGLSYARSKFTLGDLIPDNCTYHIPTKKIYENLFENRFDCFVKDTEPAAIIIHMKRSEVDRIFLTWLAGSLHINIRYLPSFICPRMLVAVVFSKRETYSRPEVQSFLTTHRLNRVHVRRAVLQ